MRRVAAALFAFCLFACVDDLSAQQGTVIHGVSLRGDPSTKNPPIGHLNKNSTVTLLAVKPKAGFYHVKTSDGTEGWVGVKYLSVEGPAAASSTPSAASTGTAECDATLWNHVYHQQRLKVLKDCVTVSGKLHIVRTEPDGDIHMQLTLDPAFPASEWLNNFNTTVQKGALVIEAMCTRRPTQPDAVASCQGFKQSFAALKEGAHIKVTGAFVEDTEANHGWREIHPITAVVAD